MSTATDTQHDLRKELMRATKTVLANQLIELIGASEDVTTGDDTYTATVAQLEATASGTVTLTLEVNASLGDLLSLRQGHVVTVSTNDLLADDIAALSSSATALLP